MAQMAGIFVLTIGSVAGIVLIFSALARVVQRAVPAKEPTPAQGADDQRMLRLEQAVVVHERDPFAARDRQCGVDTACEAEAVVPVDGHDPRRPKQPFAQPG